MNNKNKSRLGQNVKYAAGLLAGLALFGLSGCSKAREYTVAVESFAEETTQDMGSIAEQGEERDDSKEAAGVSIYVDVCGAVKYPGVYELAEDARAFEALERAGGFLDVACTAAVNQAEKLQDGQKLYIPTKEEWERNHLPEDSGGQPPVSDGLVNINTADVEELCSLPGVGESRAKAIIQYREEHGAFGAIEEIQNVSGIKNGLFLKMKDLIKVK